jgi:hypothetical protein
MDPIVYTPTITTLYDLIEALQEQVAPEDDAVVTAAVVHLFNADYVRWPHAIKKGGKWILAVLSMRAWQFLLCRRRLPAQKTG